VQESSIVTAGLSPASPDEPAMNLLRHQTQGYEIVAKGIAAHAPDAFVICITNPLDAMVWRCANSNGLPHHEGSGHAVLF